MGWETRRGKGRYYTRSHRIGGQVHREYIGSGELARLTAELDRLTRVEREYDQEAWRQEKDLVLAREKVLVELDVSCTALVTLQLNAAGYHRHNFGEWRKRRGTKRS
jgi:hypothetical protein